MWDASFTKAQLIYSTVVHSYLTYGVTIVAVRTVPSDQVCLIGSTGLDSGLVLVERSVKEWVGVLRDSKCGLLKQCFIQDEVCIEVLI